MSPAKLIGLPITLTSELQERAAQLAAEQATVSKGKQVYLNTLAVGAVYTYLKWIGIQANLSAGDSWQAGLSSVFDTADLIVPGIGRLECRPVLPGASSFTIPLEATCDRIGYVAVQFHEQLDSVELLGFLPPLPEARPALEPAVISLNDLLPLDALLNALHPINHLRQWLEGIFDQERWGSPESLMGSRFSAPQRSIATVEDAALGPESALPPKRDSISKAKLVELGAAPHQAVILVIQATDLAADEAVLNVRVKLYPTNGARHLPRNLKVTILGELGDIIAEAQTRDEDISVDIELLDCHPFEQFSVSMTLQDMSAIEEFIV